MEAYAQTQWFTTQTPLLVDHHPSSSQTPQWAYPMHLPTQQMNPIMNLIPFYSPHHMGQIYTPWFQPINSFNPLSPYATPNNPYDPLNPLDNPPLTLPPAPNELDNQTRQ